MPDLERDLELLRSEVALPHTPDIAGEVARRMAVAGAPPAHPRVSRRLALALAVVAFLLIAAGAVAAIPDARHAVLRALGLEGATVERAATQPHAPVAHDLHLGPRVSLRRAGREVGFRPLVPHALGRPDRVAVSADVPGGQLFLVYPPGRGFPRSRFTGVGLLVGEFRGDLNPELITKAVGPGGRIRRLAIGGHRAIWIAGAPHELFYGTAYCGATATRVRLAGNVLLVQRGHVLVRIEGAMGRKEARRIAASLRPAAASQGG
jgi:hypothetical protein